MNSISISTPEVAQRASFILSLSQNSSAGTAIPASAQTPVPQAEPEADGKKSKVRPVLIGLGAAAAITALAVGGIIMFKGKGANGLKSCMKNAEKMQGEVSELLPNIDKLKNEALGAADGCLAKAQNIVDEIVDIFQKGKENNYAEVIENGVKRVFDNSSDGIVKLTEYGADDAILRKAAQAGSEIFVDDFANKLSVTSKRGIIEYFGEGLEILGNDCRKYAREFSFDFGQISNFRKDVTYSGSNIEKTAHELTFNSGLLTRYSEGIENLSDGTRKIAKICDFNEGVLSRYDDGISISPDNIWSYDKVGHFGKNGMFAFEENKVRLPGGNKEIARELDFNIDGRPDCYRENSLYDNNYEFISAEKTFKPDSNGKWKEDAIQNLTDDGDFEPIDFDIIENVEEYIPE